MPEQQRNPSDAEMGAGGVLHQVEAAGVEPDAGCAELTLDSVREFVDSLGALRYRERDVSA